MKNCAKCDSFRSKLLFVAVMTTRFGADTMGSMSPLALVMSMNATFCVLNFASICAKSDALRSGPGMLILDSGPSPLPWPMRTSTI